MGIELWLPRHALHSARLSMRLDGRLFDWTSPLPADLNNVVKDAGH